MASKPELYQQLAIQLRALFEDEHDMLANAANLAALLYHTLPDVSWAGCYFQRGQVLTLGPFQGKVACTRIPLGRGVCGTAALTGTTIVVDNVHEFPGHIACDSASNAEIVVPILKHGRLVGVLDLDSPVFGRFDADDRAGLESLVEVFVQTTAIAES